jgi:hypothetical protein
LRRNRAWIRAVLTIKKVDEEERDRVRVRDKVRDKFRVKISSVSHAC